MIASADQAIGMAIAHYQNGRLSAAETLCRQVLAAQPLHAEASRWMGIVALASGRLDEAVQWLSRAVAQVPENAAYHSDLGAAFRLRGQLDDAVASFRRAVQLDAELPDAHLNLGEALTDLGQYEDAVPSCRRGVELRPDYAVAHNNLGNALARLGQREEALACYRRALALQPGYAEAHNNIGNVFTQLERWDEAAACFRQALALNPSLAEAHNDLARVFIETGHMDEAFVCSQRALALRPNFAEAYGNIGLILTRKGFLREAIASYRRALESRSDLVIVRWNLSLLLLLFGQWEEGWREHEWRLRCLDLMCARYNTTATRWHGGPISGKTLLVHAEQGFGDTIHFMRYVPLVRERAQAARVIVECQPALTRLLTQSGEWNAEIVAHREGDDAAPPEFDFHVPMHSLPLVLGMVEPLAMTNPYLRADDELRAAWRERLRPGFRVGIAWAGNATHKDDVRRSMAFEKLAPLLRVAGVTFYNLQLGVSGNIEPIVDLTSHLTDFADTAAFVSELDLVIAVDTAVVHLAGALGRPVWTMVATLPDWRWGLGREDTPWYPTMRLFRQHTAGDWSEVIARVAAELEAARP